MPSDGPAVESDAQIAPVESYLSEALLWRELRARPGGLRFSRQRATGRYRHDFYCRDARLAVELEPAGADPEREAWLARAGIATIRLSARRVLEGSTQAAREIIMRAQSLLPEGHPALALQTGCEAGSPIETDHGR
ncbi:MAG: endonuclease domain-containing protein [Erythrobacter sp.]